MKIAESSLRRLVRQVITEQVGGIPTPEYAQCQVLRAMSHLLVESEPEADKDDVYGEFLFGTADVRPDVVPEEPDTAAEQAFKKSLMAWFKGDRNALSRELVNSLVDLKRQGKYLPVLDPGDGRVYRMLSVDYEKWPGLNSDERLELEQKHSLVVPGRKLPLQRGKIVGSWTKDPEMFLSSYSHFDALLGGGGKNTLAICVADIGANPSGFLFNPEHTGKLAGRYSYQAETLQVAPINLVECHYYLIDPNKTSSDAHRRIFSGDWRKMPTEKAAVLSFVSGQSDQAEETQARLSKKLKDATKLRRLFSFF